jgi:branched-chain amino acid transport system permease protein
VTQLIAIVIDGFVYAAWLFIIAAGLTLIYGVMRILNMSHGSFYAIGAYGAATLVGWYYATGGVPWGGFAMLILAALVTGVVVGTAIERGLLRFMYGRDEIVMILVTYGILLILEDAIKLVWGVEPYFAYQPYTELGRSRIAGLSFANYDFLLIGVSAAIGLALWYGLSRTTAGVLLRVVIHDREAARAIGINVRTTFLATFLIGATLGTAAGALTAPSLSVVPGIGIEVIVLAFAVVVIGGLGSVPGAMVGALIVGLSRSAAVHLYPDFELFVIYAVMGVVLALRPEGLFAAAQARKI